MIRRETKEVKIGKIKIGGSNKIAVQSMLNTDPHNIEACIEQTARLKNAGCDIVRLTIPDIDAVKTIYEIKNSIDIPLVADIHFDYRLAIASADAGIDKIRINPGNIGDKDRVKQVVSKCNEKNIPIRIGVNSGSLEKDILSKYGSPTPEALAESTYSHIRLLEEFDFDDIVLSLKSSSVSFMIDAYRIIAERCNYPLHLGVTEAGTREMGIIKSAIGIGSLLNDGIGDTIRVSLTENPVEEVIAARKILKGLGFKGYGPQIVSCPTCGRTKIDLISLAKRVEAAIENINKDITVAIMGCVVNGPGEAREADIGIAGGDGKAVIFKKDKIVKTVNESDIEKELIKEIDKM